MVLLGNDLHRGVYMIINHSISALQITNNLSKSTTNTSKTMQKLSSGKSINTASDNAAGLGISQKMTAQIRGLAQAERNIQDGINLVQTAESGLNKINDPNLMRLKELAIQAANDTFTSQDRKAIQKEVEQIKGSIDDIANHTEFNTTKVLRPPVDKGNPPPQGKADVLFVIDNSISMGSIQGKVADNLTNLVNQVSSEGVSDIRFGAMDYTSGSTIHSFASGSSWTDDPKEVADTLNSLSSSTSGVSENLATAMTKAMNEYSYRDNGTNQQVKHMILVSDEDADDISNQSDIDQVLSELSSNGVRVHGAFRPVSTGPESTEEFDQFINQTGGKSVDINDSNWGNQLSSIIGKSIGEEASTTEENDMPPLSLQVGPSSGDQFDVSLFDARTTNLGIDGIQMDTKQEALNSLSKIEGAMDQVLSEQSRYGSYTNALDHISNNVSNYKINLTESKSRIADTDMANQSMKLVKEKLLTNVSQSLLAKANQKRQDVLAIMK
ncbi:flagellin [Pontibacillus yanchengensis]|nr:flagellin [Pontibacillus yanchengensis]